MQSDQKRLPTHSNSKQWICGLTMRSKGSCVLAALSNSSLYSSSSHSLCRVLSGSLSCTGMVTLDRSLPMLFLRMFHRLMVLLLGLGEGRRDLRWQRTVPSSAEPGNRWLRGQDTDSALCGEDYQQIWKLSYCSFGMTETSIVYFIFQWGLQCMSHSLPEFGLSLSVSLLKLSIEMLSLMSLMYESSSET